MAEKRKPKRTSRTSDERFDAVKRLLERRLEQSFAELDRRDGRPARPWREAARDRIERLYRRLDDRSTRSDAS